MIRPLRWLPLLLAAPVFAQNCTYGVTPASVSISAAEATPQFTVTASPGLCTWTSRSNVDWITISFGQTGAGNGTVGVRILANREAVSRSGSLTIAGQTVSIQQAAAVCTFTLNPESAIANAAGGLGFFLVNTTCAWQATTNVDWIDVTSPPGGRGTGTSQVAYSVRANTGATRTGTIQVGPIRFTVQQPAGVCAQSLSPAQVNLPLSGGNGTVQVTSNCAWTAGSNAPWIMITGGAASDRDGTLAYSVQANASAQARTGTIRVGNQTFTVNQAGTGCNVTLTPASASYSASGGSGTIAVSSICSWTAAASDTWITITAGAATVAYTVAPNTSASSRAGSIAIGNQTFAISQAANGCTVTLSPASVQISAGGGSGNFLVSGQPGCPWTVASDADWITLNIGSGDGSGTVIYSVAANPGSARTAVIQVNQQRFGVSQAGVLPSFTAAGVLNAASFIGGSVAPGMIVTIFGSGLGPSSLTVANPDSPSRKFPTELAGTRVLFDGMAAPLLYVSATQLSAIVPFGLAGRQTTLIQVEVRGVLSQTVFMPVSATAPGIFTQSAQGFGAGAILNEDFTVNGPDKPAAPGSFVFVFATGGGVVDPATEDGALAAGAAPTLARVTAEIDGQAAEVVYAGAAPELVAGVLQVNLRVPAQLGPGERLVIIRSGATASHAGVTVSVR